MGIRLSGDEKDHDGLEAPDMIEIARALAAEPSLDYLNVTAGTSAGLAGSTHIVPSMRSKAGYTAPLAAAIREVIDKPVFVAGRINQPQIAEDVLQSGAADMCGMTRSLISDPEMRALSSIDMAEAARTLSWLSCATCRATESTTK